jgi:hypothetical protein
MDVRTELRLLKPMQELDGLWGFTLLQRPLTGSTTTSQYMAFCVSRHPAYGGKVGGSIPDEACEENQSIEVKDEIEHKQNLG